MTRHLFPRAHLPHPHIAEILARAFAVAAVRRNDKGAVIVPDGRDWNEWHWLDSRRDADYEHRGKERE